MSYFLRAAPLHVQHTAARHRAMTSLEFDSLPLQEVAVRLAASPPLRLDLGAIVALARRAEATFPRVANVLGPEVVPGRGVSIVHLAKLTDAVRLLDDERGVEGIVQPEVVVLRWRADAGPSYPRYDAMRKTLEGLVATLTAVLDQLGRQAPAFDVATFSYVNAIPCSTAEPLGGAALAILAPDARPQIIPEQRPFHELVLSWQEMAGSVPVDVRIDLRSGAMAQEGRQDPVYLLVSSAGTRLAPDSDPLVAVDVLHDHLQGFFGRVISNESKEVWGHVPA